MPCFGVEGLYSGHEVNIGYRPWRTVRPTAIRVARDPAAAVGPGRHVLLLLSRTSSTARRRRQRDDPIALPSSPDAGRCVTVMTRTA
jgi:hypothetical protein